MPPLLGCQVSEIAPTDPFIADFTVDGVIPIGGMFVYPSPGGPLASTSSGALHVTLVSTGMVEAQYMGVGIYFNGNAEGTDCIDATTHSGVQFDISGSVGGTGCTSQYATTDSVHSSSEFDPKGAGDSTVYAPQAPLTVTATPTTVRMPFVGVSAPSGGNPAIGVDKARLTGVQWQFTTAAGTENSCLVDVTIDNVRFF